MGTNTAKGLDEAATAVISRLAKNDQYNGRRTSLATEPSTKNKLPTAMLSPAPLRAAATANAHTHTPNATAKSARDRAAAIPLPPANSAIAGSDPARNNALLAHDHMMMRRPAVAVMA